MKEELKVRIKDYQALEQRLLKHGARFIKETDVLDTYFKHPSGEVWKIARTSEGDFFINLKPQDGKFGVAKTERVDNADELHRDFESTYGIKNILKKKCRFFEIDGFVVDINLIDDVGECLVMTKDDPTPEDLRAIGVDSTDFIRVPFDELPRDPDAGRWYGK